MWQTPPLPSPGKTNFCPPSSFLPVSVFTFTASKNLSRLRNKRQTFWKWESGQSEWGKGILQKTLRGIWFWSWSMIIVLVMKQRSRVTIRCKLDILSDFQCCIEFYISLINISNWLKASLNRTQQCTKTLLTVHSECTKTLLTVHSECTKTLLTVHCLSNYMF